ncbi:pilus assembly protein TadG-related protein [Nakamurella endophytica]|uniref:Putative Flp pilus-assembly TadG-like N-terminal domain-containing protein n=1 Tax=Nakamurella endophytica TaxID=1748367 RepID=A0A917T452_9ACTN|nr:pilus assembly protein TadG-related protein [Nakamurella endophytica]GGM07720.1 hypothetical protein GCM10011594_29600 [Nakamurella endophytica]
MRHGRDRGSVTPLVLGMLACLLLLAAGVTAAGSAFLGGQRTQNLCDGAAAAAADAIDPRTGGAGQEDAAVAAAQRYLAVRGETVGVVVGVDAGTVRVTCTADVPVAFGVVFGHPTLRRTVTAAGTPVWRDQAR